jgi:hypothetical protein
VSWGSRRRGRPRRGDPVWFHELPRCAGPGLAVVSWPKLAGVVGPAASPGCASSWLSIPTARPLAQPVRLASSTGSSAAVTGLQPGSERAARMPGTGCRVLEFGDHGVQLMVHPGGQARRRAAGAAPHWAAHGSEHIRSTRSGASACPSPAVSRSCAHRQPSSDRPSSRTAEARCRGGRWSEAEVPCRRPRPGCQYCRARLGHRACDARTGFPVARLCVRKARPWPGAFRLRVAGRVALAQPAWRGQAARSGQSSVGGL